MHGACAKWADNGCLWTLEELYGPTKWTYSVLLPRIRHTRSTGVLHEDFGGPKGPSAHI